MATRNLQQALTFSESGGNIGTEGILDAMADGISIHDTELRVLYQNKAHRAMMGEHVGKFCFAAYRQREFPCEDCHLIRAFRDAMVNRREVYSPLSGARMVEIISSPLLDEAGRVVAGIEVVRDISDRKRTEEEIRRMNEGLNRRATELSVANQELESFSYSLSHDMRSYLSRISMAVQLLEGEYMPAMDQTASRLVRMIHDAEEGMDELIQSMLELFRTTRADLQRTRVDLNALAGDVAAILAAGDPSRRCTIVIHPEIEADGDRGMLRIVLENLLGNAWKYTARTKDARIEFGKTLYDGREVYFVRDNGPGFHMKDATSLFKPFRRLHSAQDYPGTGIGLATVQRIIQRHHGEVWGEAEPGRGATFFFTLA